MSKLDPRSTTINDLSPEIRDALAALHPFERIAWAADNLERVETDIVVPFELDAEGHASVLVPAPEWLACAMFGGLLPPIEAYRDLVFDDGSPVLHREFHGFPVSQDGLTVANGEILRASPPVDPMTEEQAIEYLIQKDVPRQAWDTERRSNSARFAICKRHQLPSERTFRNAWRLAA